MPITDVPLGSIPPDSDKAASTDSFCVTFLEKVLKDWLLGQSRQGRWLEIERMMMG